jgi:hypothetical protein
MCYSMKIAFYQDSINLPLNLVNPEKSPRKSTIKQAAAPKLNMLAKSSQYIRMLL